MEHLRGFSFLAFDSEMGVDNPDKWPYLVRILEQDRNSHGRILQESGGVASKH